MNALLQINDLVKRASSSLPNNASNKSSVNATTPVATPVVTIKNMAPLKNFDKANFLDAYNFWNDIAPNIRLKEIGGDFLPYKEMSIFGLLPKTPVSYAKLRAGVAGDTIKSNDSRTGRKVRLSNKPGVAQQHTLVHELRHVYEKLLERIGKTHQKKSKDILQKVYGFEGVDISPGDEGYSDRMGEEELFTTNKQHQFLAYQDLARSLKKKPTSKQYFDYIMKLPIEELIRMRKRPVSGYQQHADKQMSDETIRKNIELYRKALMEVSKLGIGAEGSYGAMNSALV